MLLLKKLIAVATVAGTLGAAAPAFADWYRPAVALPLPVPFAAPYAEPIYAPAPYYYAGDGYYRGYGWHRPIYSVGFRGYRGGWHGGGYRGGWGHHGFRR